MRHKHATAPEQHGCDVARHEARIRSSLRPWRDHRIVQADLEAAIRAAEAWNATVVVSIVDNALHADTARLRAGSHYWAELQVSGGAGLYKQGMRQAISTKPPHPVPSQPEVDGEPGL